MEEREEDGGYDGNGGEIRVKGVIVGFAQGKRGSGSLHEDAGVVD